MAPLSNPRHERFTQELAKGKSASAAYRDAGFDTKGNAAEASASRLLRNAKVKDRLAELKSRGAQRAVVTLESLIQEAEDARILAMETKQSSAAVSALTAKAKLAGLWIERSEAETTNVNYAISDELPTEDEWESERTTAH